MRTLSEAQKIRALIVAADEIEKENSDMSRILRAIYEAVREAGFLIEIKTQRDEETGAGIKTAKLIPIKAAGE